MLDVWDKVIDFHILDDIITALSIQKICPDADKVFKAFQLCRYEDLKVVFLGMDPYPQKGIATGILFGNKAGTKEADLSPSLKVVREAVVRPDSISYKDGDMERFDITMESWAEQGILMLNSALTVPPGKPGGHRLIWRPFIASLLRKLSVMNTGIVYVLFGSQAASFAPCIDDRWNTVIKCKHPAYYARINSRMINEPFTQVNQFLKGKEQIKWLKDE